MLDRFDELLQATGTSQSDYLEKVADFQQREAGLGRPTGVLVTSRTTVADRARTVPDTVAVRLEPFKDSQVRKWVDIWNSLRSAAPESASAIQGAQEAVLAGDTSGLITRLRGLGEKFWDIAHQVSIPMLTLFIEGKLGLHPR
jgi:hypothetical protein